jgi:prepilin-type N-terminal cleavage/methylation domain-containing protein
MMIASRKNQAGFTLVELLVVISVLTLLVGIMVPSILSVRTIITRSNEQGKLYALTTACELYSDDFGTFPPSDYNEAGGGSYYQNFQGGHLAALLLTGYGPDFDSDGTPRDSLVDDDGAEGFGFRLSKRGPVYGPYNDVHEYEVAPVGVAVAFVDQWGGPILYYRFNEANGQYHFEDNAALAGEDVDSQSELEKLVKHQDEEGNWYFPRRDGVFVSAGPDGKFNTSDDVANFDR